MTTCHIERLFLTMRQEATALAIGVYNLVRKHTSLEGQTPAQATG